MPDFTDLSAIAVAGLALYFMWRLSSRSMGKMTEALRELRDVVLEVKIYLRNGK